MPQFHSHRFMQIQIIIYSPFIGLRPLTHESPQQYLQHLNFLLPPIAVHHLDYRLQYQLISLLPGLQQLTLLLLLQFQGMMSQVILIAYLPQLKFHLYLLLFHQLTLTIHVAVPQPILIR